MSNLVSQSKVITRFAPSPTGLLHVGGARTALFSWAYARGRGGTFLLRLEDTDQKRSSDAAAEAIIKDLTWLGLDWDNDDIPRQSQRLDRYDAVIDQLKAAGVAYDDDGAVRFRMDKDVAFDDAVYGHIEVGKDQLEDFVIKKADGFPTFHLAVVVDDIDFGVTHVIRGQEHLSNTSKHAAIYDALGATRPTWSHTPSIMNPDGSKMSKRDKAKVARATLDSMQIGNDALAKEIAPEFVPALFASAPTEFKEALTNNPGHLTLDGLDHANIAITIKKQGNEGPPPELFNDSVEEILKGFRQKQHDSAFFATVVCHYFSVQVPEIDVRDFRASGYLPDVLCNYLALLGWNPGNNVERFDRDFLCKTFDFDRINKANSKFDREKLAAFNGDTLQQMPPEDFAAKLAAHQPDLAAKLGEHFPLFCTMYQPRSKTLNDPAALGAFFFDAPNTYDDKAVKKNLTKNDGEGLGVLRDFRAILADLGDWTPEAINAAIERFTADKQLKNMGSVAQPLRVAVSGTAVTPPIDQTLALIGKDETLARIDRCLERCTEG